MKKGIIALFVLLVVGIIVWYFTKPSKPAVKEVEILADEKPILAPTKPVIINGTEYVSGTDSSGMPIMLENPKDGTGETFKFGETIK